MQVSKGVEKKHLEEFDVTDGKDRAKKEEQIEHVKELEELLGMPKMNPYGTLHRDVFKTIIPAGVLVWLVKDKKNGLYNFEVKRDQE